MDELKQTQLYNSCAHGRPTLAPLVDLQVVSPKVMHCRANGVLEVFLCAWLLTVLKSIISEKGISWCRSSNTPGICAALVS